MLEIAEETTLELQGKQKIVEAVSDPDKKKQKQEELILNELNKIYKEVDVNYRILSESCPDTSFQGHGPEK